ncbi:MAG: hypothetical protein L6Q76_02090 [Polyangiaceae bacterium]|nr:hypothetical protein [Polyangiaceae bacterium]
MSAAVLNQLLRAPGEIASNCRRDKDIRTIALTSIAAIIAGAAAFGGVIGSFRGGVQIVYGALKVPLAIMATLALCAPAFHALAAVLGRPWPMRSILSLALAAAARSSLVLLAFAPALWLALDCGMSYHAAALLASFAYALAGLAALGVLVRGIGSGDGRVLTALAFVAMFFAVGGQTAWILRPYLVRPKAQDIPFLRAREGGFSDALVTSMRSAMGMYDAPDHDVRYSIDPKTGALLVNDGDVNPRDFDDLEEKTPSAAPPPRVRAIDAEPAHPMEPAVEQPPRDTVNGVVPIDHAREIDPDSAPQIDRERSSRIPHERRR